MINKKTNTKDFMSSDQLISFFSFSHLNPGKQIRWLATLHSSSSIRRADLGFEVWRICINVQQKVKVSLPLLDETPNYEEVIYMLNIYYAVNFFFRVPGPRFWCVLICVKYLNKVEPKYEFSWHFARPVSSENGTQWI